MNLALSGCNFASFQVYMECGIVPAKRSQFMSNSRFIRTSRVQGLPFPLLAITLAGIAGNSANAQTCSEVLEPSHMENTDGFGNQFVTDAEIAVGSDLILVCSNSWLLFHDKSGDPVTNQSAELGDYANADYPFFERVSTSLSPRVGDPCVLYDYHSARFWVLADEAGLGLFEDPITQEQVFGGQILASSSPFPIPPPTRSASATQVPG